MRNCHNIKSTQLNIEEAFASCVFDVGILIFDK